MFSLTYTLVFLNEPFIEREIIDIRCTVSQAQHFATSLHKLATSLRISLVLYEVMNLVYCRM